MEGKRSRLSITRSVFQGEGTRKLWNSVFHNSVTDLEINRNNLLALATITLRSFVSLVQLFLTTLPQLSLYIFPLLLT